MEIFKEFAKDFVNMFKVMGTIDIVTSIIYLFIITLAYFFIFKILRYNEAKLLIVLFTVIMLMGGFVALFAKYPYTRYIFLIIPFTFVIFVSIVYSTEIKRIVWTRLFRPSKEKNKFQMSNINDTLIKNNINEIIKSLQNMSKNNIGALIVLSNGNISSDILDSGTVVNSSISSQLIESIFFPNTPLHDGAMIINGAKIDRASCFLPLTQNQNLPNELGTRHRAAIGITETTDVLVFVVSEESGVISIVKDGKIVRYADAEMIRNELNKYYDKLIGKKEK